MPWNLFGSSQPTFKKISGYRPFRKQTLNILPRQFTPNRSGGALDVRARAAVGQLNAFLTAYHKPSGDDLEKLAILGELWFLLERTLRLLHHVKDQKILTELYQVIVDKLCKQFDCTVNVLPQKLEDYWGRELGGHGRIVDDAWGRTGYNPNGDCATYLSAVDREQYRLRNKGGRLEMRDRSRPWKIDSHTPVPPWVPADSRDIGWSQPASGRDMMLPGFAGFALNMSRDFLMARHRGGFSKDNFFHSSYMAGNTVLCTGTIHIVEGNVIAVANDSGHYRPSVANMAQVARTLKMFGFDVSRTLFLLVPGSVPDAWDLPRHCWQNPDDKKNRIIEFRCIMGDAILNNASKGRMLKYGQANNKNHVEAAIAEVTEHSQGLWSSD